MINFSQRWYFKDTPTQKILLKINALTMAAQVKALAYLYLVKIAVECPEYGKLPFGMENSNI